MEYIEKFCLNCDDLFCTNDDLDKYCVDCLRSYDDIEQQDRELALMEHSDNCGCLFCMAVI